MIYKNFLNTRGFTLIEIIIVIIITGILAAVATFKFSSVLETSKTEAAKSAMESLACAIVGNSALYDKGVRSDFGYVGDIGALPPNLDALVNNPGYATWKGPYIKGDFAATDFKKDPWKADFQLIGNIIRSVGSGSNIDKALAPTTASLLSNDVNGIILDAGASAPGAVYKDSIAVQLIYPDGNGAIATGITGLNKSGSFSFSGVPVGNHTLKIICIPSHDTLNYSINVLPGITARLDITIPIDLW